MKFSIYYNVYFNKSSKYYEKYKDKNFMIVDSFENYKSNILYKLNIVVKSIDKFGIAFDAIKTIVEEEKHLMSYKEYFRFKKLKLIGEI